MVETNLILKEFQIIYKKKQQKIYDKLVYPITACMILKHIVALYSRFKFSF